MEREERAKQKEVPALLQASVPPLHADRHASLNEYIASLRVDDAFNALEEELSHDEFNDRQHDDHWWEERRPLYVKLHRILAQLNAQLESWCIANDVDQVERYDFVGRDIGTATGCGYHIP